MRIRGPRPGILAFCLLLFTSCDTSGLDRGQDELIPLSVGNRWYYTTSYLGQPPHDTLRTEVTRALDIVIEDRRVRAFAVALSHGDESRIPSYEWLRSNGTEGVLAHGGIAPTDTLILNQLFRKYPGQAGEVWWTKRFAYRQSTSRTFEIADTVEVQLVSTSEQIMTPAGRFTCYLYKYSFYPADDVFSFWNVYDYIAPGIGQVAEIIRSQAPGRAEEPDPIQETLLFDYDIASSK